jgi:hypothetical protein
MFSAYRTDRERRGSAGEMLQILRDAGCDMTNEHDLQMGMVSCSAALLVSGQGHTNKRASRPAEKSNAGRNDPCPCGSGKKYKKCCLDKNRALSIDSHPVAPSGLRPEILPRLWDDHAMWEDCAVLGRIIDRDPAFANVGFSKDGIASFMEAAAKEDPSLMDEDGEALGERIDNLAIRYARESGEGKFLEGLKDKFLAAATRAQSSNEMRALATGICMALMGEASADPEDSLLNIIFFRRAFADVVQSSALIGKVLDRLSGDAEELRHLIASDDPSAREKIESCLKSLTSSEIDTLQTNFEKSREELWNTIASGEFPVPLPFATQMAMFGRFASLTRNDERPSPETMYEIIDAFSNELIEEDYAVYARMLDHWLTRREERYGHVAKAVEMMAGLCALRSIDDLVPSLFIRGGRSGLFVPFDAQERRFIDGSAERHDDPELLAEYGAWLTAKGYPGMATRLLESWKGEASSEPPELLPARKASVG